MVIVKLVVAASAVAVAILAFPAFLALCARGTQIFEPQQMDFALLAFSVFGIALGVQIAPWRTSRKIAVLSLLSSAALLFGALAIFSIGLAVLPVGLVLLLVLYRALRHMPATTVRSRAALGGAASGFGIPLLLIAGLVPATVKCFPNGGGATSSGRWRGGQFTTSGGAVSADGTTSIGRMEFSDSVVTFRCEDGRLVEFQRTPR